MTYLGSVPTPAHVLQTAFDALFRVLAAFSTISTTLHKGVFAVEVIVEAASAPTTSFTASLEPFGNRTGWHGRKPVGRGWIGRGGNGEGGRLFGR